MRLDGLQAGLAGVYSGFRCLAWLFVKGSGACACADLGPPLPCCFTMLLPAFLPTTAHPPHWFSCLPPPPPADTVLAADLTIMEEGTELLHRLTDHLEGHPRADEPMPMFTSCCPGWVGEYMLACRLVMCPSLPCPTSTRHNSCQLAVLYLIAFLFCRCGCLFCAPG